MWIAIIIGAVVISMMLDSDLGKVILGAGAVALGCWALSAITDMDFFFTIIKICGVGVVLILLWIVLSAIFGK